MNPKALLVTTVLLLPIYAACATKSARLKSADEEIGLNIDRVGTAELEKITATALAKLFAVHKSNVNVAEPYLVAFAGIDSKGAEELRDQREALLDIIEREINDAGPYRAIARKFVERANQEVDIRQMEDLFLPKYQERFIEVLGKMGQTPRYLIWASYTTQTDKVSERITEVTYNCNVSMIDVQTGQFDQKGDSQRKEYKNSR